jgi:hypothetical protein
VPKWLTKTKEVIARIDVKLKELGASGADRAGVA